MECNLDCHYCCAYDNQVQGMTEETARRSIDCLCDTRCRVLALMGGEVLMRPEVINQLGDAGAATFNLALDSIEERPEPKSLAPILRGRSSIDGDRRRRIGRASTR